MFLLKFDTGPLSQYAQGEISRESKMEQPGDLNLDDLYNLPANEKPPDLPPPVAMLPSNQSKTNVYHADPRKLMFCFRR